ncbi:MAG: sigma-70 family RNA polymerase sigma factor [Bacteroidales bacterium]|nr:sigma-70 family RNA polymerase sigma factor [Bacteroidales bacterium]
MTAKEYNTSALLWADDAMRFAVRVCGSKADSEDAVQEALASLWQRRDSVALEKGKGYLLSCTYRRLMSLFRHRNVQYNYAAEQQGAAQRTQAPDEGFDLRDAIERSMDQLPAVQRAILQLRDVEGYSYAEIGENLALPEERVQVYLFRARVAMRKYLKQLGYDNNQ